MGSSPPQVMFGSSSGQVAYGMFDVLNPLSGNRNDGVFQATVTLGSFAQAGNWRLQSLLLADEAGNMKHLMPHNSSMVTGAGFALGSATDDVITGSAGDDRMFGFSGNDNLYAASGNDVVDAGEGDDLIVGGDGAGDDSYIGGSGTDTIKYTSARAGITVDLASASNQARSTGKDFRHRHRSDQGCRERHRGQLRRQALWRRDRQ